MPVRRRHTFFFDFNDPEAIERFDFNAETQSLTTTHFSGPREDRIIVPSSVLQKGQFHDIYSSLQSIEKLQVKWSKNVVYNHKYPAAIVKESGLHIEIVPKKDHEPDWDGLKATLSNFFGVSFENSKSFINANDFKSFYSPLDNLSTLTKSIQTLLCSDSSENCISQINELSCADSLSITYGILPYNAKESQSPHDLIVETYWANRKDVQNVLSLEKSVISKLHEEKVEIGILSVHPEYSSKFSVWGVTGFTRNLDASKNDKVLFQFTMKHRPTDSTYYAEFSRPTGLHPKHQLYLEAVRKPLEKCSLFSKYTFDKSLFLDRYQLQDLDQATPNRPPVGHLHKIWGETDLEEPKWAAPGWGSEALVQLYTKGVKNSDDSMTFELPTHSRYESPQLNSTFVKESQPWPVVFWACKPPIEDESNFENNIPSAVETKNLGYESIFPNDTIFYYFNPVIPDEWETQKLESTFDIPVAPFEAYGNVQIISVIVIFGGFFYILYLIFGNFFKQTKLVDSTDKDK